MKKLWTPPPSELVSWVVLIALLGVNLRLSYMALGPGSPAISLAISAIQVVIVVLVLVKLWRAQPMARVFALAGLFFLLILFGLSGMDYATRPYWGPEAATAQGAPR